MCRRAVLVGVPVLILGALTTIVGCGMTSESWTLVKLLNKGEKEYQTTEVVQVRNCGIEERKGINCSAGTLNDLSVSFGAGAGQLVGVSGEVNAELGISQQSGESLDLPLPAPGYIYRYTIRRDIKITQGQATARSSSGNEQTTEYSFQAHCALTIENKETMLCLEIISQPSVASTTSAIATNGISNDCMAIVSSSRPLVQHETGDACWFKLIDGGPATLSFNGPVQVTYRTASSGNDVYFFIAGAGESLTDVVGATVRPERAVLLQFGSFEAAKSFEISYHSYGGDWPTCLRDANNGNQPLTALCK